MHSGRKETKNPDVSREELIYEVPENLIQSMKVKESVVGKQKQACQQMEERVKKNNTTKQLKH